jgi:hypothetical protein
MKGARLFHTATLLADGRVLLAGGQGSNGSALDTAEVYEPKTDTFSPTSSKMKKNRSQFTTTLLPDGRVLLVGGFDGSSSLDTAEVFDPNTMSFLTLAGFSCEGCRLNELPDSRVFLSGGSSPSSSIVSSNAAPVPALPLAFPRSHHATLALDGAVLLAGGFPPASGDASVALTSIERHDPVLGSQIIADLNAPRAHHSATRLSDGRMLFVGGVSSGKTVDTFEIWTPGEAKPSVTGTLARPRSHHAAALLPDGTVLLAGGLNDSGPEFSVEVFDPRETSTPGKTPFVTVSQANLGRDTRAAFLVDGSVLLSGEVGSARYVPSQKALLSTDLPAGARLATLSSGDALGCGVDCGFLAPGTGLIDARFLSLTSNDLALQVGTSEVFFAGSRPGQGWFGWAPTQPKDARRPLLDPLASDKLAMGDSLTVSGQRFLRGSAVGAVDNLPSVNGVATLSFRPLDNAGPVHVLKATDWTDTSVSFTVPFTAYTGPGWLYVTVDGVASEPRLLTILPTETGKRCQQNAECASGFCVEEGSEGTSEKICCDQACEGGCVACSAKRKGKGEDGVCEAIVQDGEPRFGCAKLNESVCGFTGKCDGIGQCALPPSTTTCDEVPNGRCIAGVCSPPPPQECDVLSKELTTADGTVVPCKLYGCFTKTDGVGACKESCADDEDCLDKAECIEGQCFRRCDDSKNSYLDDEDNEILCKEYRCSQGACLTECSSHADCAPNHRCSDESKGEGKGACKPVLAPSVAQDPGACSLASPGARRPAPGALLLVLSALLLVRPRRSPRPSRRVARRSSCRCSRVVPCP